ncbi:hypothetical protein [Streptomyces sp. MJM1172]|uniref:hypothetical protein n=1 Tax=Streptomyces sp. MJM1172 TaxID=1703926 RepID=UPI000AD839A5|nr:hypothetical protein [Streptomyces sp. MJM1172]
MYALHLVLTLLYSASAVGSALALSARSDGRKALACSTALVVAFAVAMGSART